MENKFSEAASLQLANLIDPDNFENFLIQAPCGNIWGLDAYQDPRSKKMIGVNSVYRTGVDAWEFYFFRQTRQLEVEPNTMLVSIELGNHRKQQRWFP